jgi:hypothetical protein
VLTRLTVRERQRYELAVRLAFRHDRVGPSVFGSPGRMASLAAERRRWRSAVRARAVGAPSVVVSDVADCYRSIGERAIRMAAARAGGDPGALVAAIGDYRELGGHGIPIGPAQSAIVADAVLAFADDRARSAGCMPVRWVDDVVFAGERHVVARASRAWRLALVELGMHEHDGKRTTDPIGVLGSPEAVSGHGIMRGT